MVKRHEEVAPYILELAKHASKTGEPIVRSIAYEFNERPDITDEFLLGDKYLVAPVLQEGFYITTCGKHMTAAAKVTAKGGAIKSGL